jgi:hypothetical protein
MPQYIATNAGSSERTDDLAAVVGAGVICVTEFAVRVTTVRVNALVR